MLASPRPLVTAVLMLEMTMSSRVQLILSSSSMRLSSCPYSLSLLLSPWRARCDSLSAAGSYLVAVRIELLAGGGQQFEAVQQGETLQRLPPVPAVLVDGVEGGLGEEEDPLLGVVGNDEDSGEVGGEELS